MSQIKYYIVTVLLLFSCAITAQNNDIEDIDVSKLRITNIITQSEFDLKRGDFFNSKENLDMALELSIKVEDKKSQGIILAKIGELQFITNKFDKSLASLIKAAEIQREIEDIENLAITYSIKGALHAGKEEYKDALEYLNSAKTLFEEKNLNTKIPEVTLTQGKVHFKLKEYKTAKSLFENTIVLAKKNNQADILSKALIYNSKTLLNLGNEKQSIQSALEGLNVAKSNNQIHNIDEAFLSLSEIYEKNRDFEQAHNYLLKHSKISDSILTIERANISPTGSTDYIEAFNADEFKKLKKQIEDQESESNLAKVTTILSIALITILSLLTLSLYKNNNIRLKSNNMLQEKNDDLIEAMKRAELASKTKANFLSTVTHELRTPLY
ncbi:MAG: tetratricopeptide (TPR) repeat protein, partial [Psychroserpens sp.]